MITTADRLAKVEEYYFSKKLAEIRQMNKLGSQVINLGIGSPDLSPDDHVVQSVIEAVKEKNNHSYQPYNGIPELRAAFAEWYSRKFRVVLDPASEILPLMGSKEGIMHISLAYLNPGDEVLIPNPGYPPYRSVTELLGAVPVIYDLNEATHWQPNIEQLERSDLKKVKIMWITYPNMPTGTRGNLELFQRLIQFAKKHEILLVNDNPYAFILNDKPISILEVDGAKDIALELNSLSKSHNMAGWRIGMVCGRDDFIANILRVKSNMDSGMFKPLQMAAVKALSLPDQWYASVNKVYSLRKEFVFKIFDTLGCRYDVNQTGLFVWAEIPAEAISGEHFAEQILHTKRVFITPGFIFGSQGDRYLRASLCQPVTIIEQALNRIIS